MRTLFLSLIITLSGIIAYPQAKTSVNDIHNVYDEKGDYYFDKKEYKKAIVYYNMAYKLDPANYYAILKKAEAFNALNLYDQGAECYRVLFNSNLEIPNEHRLNYALLLLKNKDIKGFETWLAKYNEIVYSEIYNYTTATEIRAKMYKDSTFIIVENENILNSPESEIAPAFYKDYILFASNRKNLAATSGTPFYNIFSASYTDNGQLGKLNIFNKSLNSAQNESHIYYSDATKKLYTTRSAMVYSGLKVITSNTPTRPDENLNTSEFTIEGSGNIGHVCFDSKGIKMYFVSEAPGGIGGTDLYTSDLVGGKWSKPKNMGSIINTPKNELYPCLVNDTLLYFTSAGHKGFGGLDLYSVNLKSATPVVKNLGNAVNSASDDYSLAFSPGGITGYFSSNRPGGFGKEDIYRLHLLDMKVKLPAYKFKKKSGIEKDKINLYVSNGTEYNITSEDKSGFSFGFIPEIPYKIVIQHENPLASNIIYNDKLTAEQKEKEFLNPQPLEKSEIKLQAGMKYQFTAGIKPISADFKQALKNLSADYQNSSNTIDLTALAKELQMNEGEIYSIRFIKDDNIPSDSKSAKASNLFVNNQTVSIPGESFFIILPLDIQANFNIQTDLTYLKENYNPKKVGNLSVDAEPVLKAEPIELMEGFPILVNTESFGEIATGKKILATELTIIPGTMYILSFKKTDASADDPGVVVPLTKGVKYNLGTEGQSEAAYNKMLAQMSSAQSLPNEELIDISVLSKELDIMSERDIVFNLTPAKQFGSQVAEGGNVLTTLSVDGRKYYVTNRSKMQVNLKLDRDKKVNIQTDLSYIKENFETSTFALKVDTTSFNKDLKNSKKEVITDPVYDVVIVNFALNDYSIRPDAKSILASKVIEVLRNDSRLYVTITGYTDPLGDAAYNEKLSRNRAQSVRDFLSANGITDSRIRTFSYGETQALKEGQNWEKMSESELEKHRKVEIVIYLPK